MKIKHIAIAATFAASTLNIAAQNIERAELFKEHGLSSEAKAECILIITSSNPEAEKATAYYILGMVAFDEKRISTALETWVKLTKQFPQSKEAKEVSARIKDLAQVVGENTRETLNNAVAQSYLSHGEFWSRGKSGVFSIDSSWIPSVESANKWYDKMVQEFPNTTAAKVGYEQKMRTILGWSEPGRDGGKHGIEANPSEYIPMLVATFQDYEKAFPGSGALQAFRYQIAQAYWGIKDWDQTRIWLKSIIEYSEGSESFYTDLARRRLEKVEY
jgi:hypothetical protein